MMRRAVGITIISAVTLVFALGLAIWQARTAGGTLAVGTPNSTFSMAEAEAFSAYPLYSAGTAVDGLPLTAMLHDRATVSFIYGDCEVTEATGCAPPAEVQIWAACRRNLSMYTDPFGPRPDLTTVRGVPAAFFNDSGRLEIYTGISTIVIFSGSRERSLAIARALRGVNVSVGPEGDLPVPAKGAVTGDLRCGL